MEYKDTIFLPKTTFEMRANLHEKEPKILDNWNKQKIFKQLRERSQGREKFVLHDGPPYANGHIHMGTALNKILKDIIVRTQQMDGKDSIYVPGWDCHGLPIEWKIEEQYRKIGKDKDKIPIVKFRKECREFAEKWIEIQKKEFRRLGVEGDWENPYLTMSFEAEAQIVRELGKFLIEGSLKQGVRPVLWSVVEKTALADAEVEYKEHLSTTVFVKFNVVESKIKDLIGSSIVIWTTTPWTIPGNRALAYGEDIDYQLLEIKKINDDSLSILNEKIVVAIQRKEDVLHECGILEVRVLKSFKGKEMDQTICNHPFLNLGYNFKIRALSGDFVTLEQGTGIVHCAPGHGADDYNLGIKYNIEIVQTVKDDGYYNDKAIGFEGEHVYKVDPKIALKLKELGKLLGQGTLQHSYPHSWRSKAPLIFRNTPQWFISMESHDLRIKALQSIDETVFYPPQGKTRLRSMIETRPDWCISRQRVWGVPLPIFINKKNGEPLRDQNVIDRIADIFEQEGGDAWFNSDPQRFLGDNYDANDFEQLRDIVEVWFDSGSTHAFVLEKRKDLKWPASMYLEGSDQHRGWFHSSLLESSGTRGRAPYDSILTHGFVVDGKGRKMSKSLGNVISPEEVIKKYGVDILRLWVVASDYYDDIRLDNTILNFQADSYRRIRNTFRYLIGNLQNFTSDEEIDINLMPQLECYILHRLWDVDQTMQKCVTEFDFHLMFKTLLNFCSNDLSAFYFDIRKDCIYCDSQQNDKRRSTRTVLRMIFEHLVRWFAPSLSFTCEEAWQAYGKKTSIHLEEFCRVPANYKNNNLETKWNFIKDIRRVITGALELKRAEKIIGSSLQANINLYLTEEQKNILESVDIAEIGIVSSCKIFTQGVPRNVFKLESIKDVAVEIVQAEGKKCARCWKILPEVVGKELCLRCSSIVD